MSTISRRRGRSVFRLTIQTRSRETHELAVNLNDELHPAELREDISWLLAAGAPPPLVEAFGGYFPEYGIFTEEFIPGETVAQLVERLEKAEEIHRLKPLWPFVCWASLAAHVDFWDRTGRRLALHEPAPSAFIVPPHDNQPGARLVSITDRTPCTTFDKVLDRFVLAFMGPIETANPALRGEVEDGVVFSAVIEALGLERGLALLEGGGGGKRGAAIAAWLEQVEADGYTPRQVYFAARRFARWSEMNLNASEEADREDARRALALLPPRRGRAAVAGHPGPLLPLHRLRRRAARARRRARPAHGARARPPRRRRSTSRSRWPRSAGPRGPRRRGLLPRAHDLPPPAAAGRRRAHLDARAGTGT